MLLWKIGFHIAKKESSRVWGYRGAVLVMMLQSSLLSLFAYNRAQMSWRTSTKPFPAIELSLQPRLIDRKRTCHCPLRCISVSKCENVFIVPIGKEKIRRTRNTSYPHSAEKTRKAIQNGPHGLAPADAHRESSLASMFELSKKRSCIMTAEFGCA